MERKLFNPQQGAPPRRKEWITISGGDLCVWSFTVADTMQILERSERPKVDPRGGYNTGQLSVLQVLFACYKGEEEGAERIFTEADLPLIWALPHEDFTEIQLAIARLNGKDADTEAALLDFTGATEALNTSASPLSVSKNSAGSPKR